MNLTNPFALSLLCLLSPFLSRGQGITDDAHSHFGIFTHLVATKQVFNYELASSVFKPGYTVGMYHLLDLGSRLQLRIGGAVTSYRIDEKDYSPSFPGDYNPVTGEVDIRKSYMENKVNIAEINLPVNIRYKLWGTEKHVFVAGGIEGRWIIHDRFEARILESGVHYLEFDPDPIYDVRKSMLAGHLELGYEVPWKGHKLNVSLVSKYGFSTQIKGEGHAFYGIYQGHRLDIGLGLGLIF